MDTHAVIILGVWAFAVATALSKQVAGWFMCLSFIAAIAVSIILV